MKKNNSTASTRRIAAKKNPTGRKVVPGSHKTETPTSKAKNSAAASVALPMLSVNQADYQMVAFVAQASHLRRIVSFSRRAEDREKGFQRHFKDSRLRAIGRYIDAGQPIPNNIIIDFDSSCVKVDEVNRTITLPTETECGLVIDGQHRLLGFDYANIDYPLLVLGFVGLAEKEKVKVFVTINTEQKRLSTSLCLDLLNIIGDEANVETRCRDIVAAVNEDEASPWYSHIDMTGETSGMISLVNFVRKLKPHLTGAGFMKSLDVTDQCKIVINYWTGIRAVFADQWGNSLLTKTVGFGALMNILPGVFSKTQAMSSGKFNAPAVIDTFKLIKDIQFDAETFGSGTGNKTEMRAADMLTDALDKAIRSQPGGSGGSALILD